MKPAAAPRAKSALINFLPDDAAHPELARREKPLAPPKGSATVRVEAPSRPGLYPPGSPGFRHWQTEQSLLYGLHAWRTLTGSPLEAWQGHRKTLKVLLDVGEDLNANYDRQHLNFYHFNCPTRSVFTCASLDVVCHEQGHALLDALRPDFWGAPYPEIGGLHESFGDCMAMLVNLLDPAVCREALRTGLDSDNLVSNLAADLATALSSDLGHPEYVDGLPPNAALRKARNDWFYVDPATLPPSALASRLSAEAHSFSRVFTGCFYDLIRNLFAGFGTQTAERLQQAAHLAGELLIAALQTVPLVPRIYKAVGDRILQADAQLHSGLHVDAIRAAFERHGLTLSSPRKSLAVPLLPRRGAASRAAVSEWFLGALGLETDEGLVYTPVDSVMHGQIAHLATFQSQELSHVDPALRGVHVLLPAAARLQLDGAAVVGRLGDPSPVGDDARRATQVFVKTLVETGNVLPDEQMAVPLPPPSPRRPGPPSHAVERIDGRRTLVRQRFACAPRPGPHR